MIAYFPQGMAYWSRERILGAPSWIDDLYDISATVSEADLAEWQKQGVTLDKKPMLQQMLQAVLAERCKLLVHRGPAEIPGFALEIGKHGPRLSESKPGVTLPPGVPLPDGGVVVPYNRGEGAQVHFYGASMEAFARQLSMMSGGHQVQDRTGLAGHYDFALSWQDVDLEHPERQGLVSSDDPDPLSHWDLDSLGLKVVRIKVPTETVVIDHIERPSEN
jgi:uncharacterized protein (TIGR03435 family)